MYQNRPVVLLALVVLAASMAWIQAADDPPPAKDDDGFDDGFVDLFARGDLSEWVEEQHEFFQQKHPNAMTWAIKDGVVHCDGSLGNCGFLRYKPVLSDFVLRLEYRMSRGCNSGIGIRAAVPYTTLKPNTLPSNVGLEVQLMDDVGKPVTEQSSGAFYGVLAPTRNAQRPADEWCPLEFVCQGDQVRVTLNGEVVQNVRFAAEPKLSKRPLKGYLSLQNHGHDIEFRNVRLKPL